MELKRSESSPSNLTNPKRRATTPAEDSPLAQLLNDVAIQALVKEIKWFARLCQNGKEFNISLQEHVNSSTEESANIISVKAREIWEFENSLVFACEYAIAKEPSLSDKLKHYTNDNEPAERMNSMMKDPWLKYILGDSVLGLEQSDAFIRGFLSILIAYWNVKDFFDKSKLGTYTRPPPYIPPVTKKDYLTYEMDHVGDVQNLKEVLESKYGSSDPALAASLFEQISNFQVNCMCLDSVWTGNRGMVRIALFTKGSSPPYPSKSFMFWALP